MISWHFYLFNRNFILFSHASFHFQRLSSVLKFIFWWPSKPHIGLIGFTRLLLSKCTCRLPPFFRRLGSINGSTSVNDSRLSVKTLRKPGFWHYRKGLRHLSQPLVLKNTAWLVPAWKLQSRGKYRYFWREIRIEARLSFLLWCGLRLIHLKNAASTLDIWISFRKPCECHFSIPDAHKNIN